MEAIKFFHLPPASRSTSICIFFNFLAYFVYESQSLPEEMENVNKAFYNALKGKLDYRLNMKITGEELNRSMETIFSNDVRPEALLHKFDFLSIENSPKQPDEFYTLKFNDTVDRMLLFANLVHGAVSADKTIANTLSKVKEVFKQEPPDVNDFRSAMYALSQIVNSIPFKYEYKRNLLVIYGIFFNCGFEPQIGSSPLDFDTIYCENIASNTRILFGIYDNYGSAIHWWFRYFRDSVVTKLLSRPVKNNLVIVAGFDPSFNWYAEYQQGRPITETVRRYEAEDHDTPLEDRVRSGRA